MTYDEAKAIIENMREEAYFMSELNALGVANKAIEKQIKYRWHDLRKNPNDLPSEDGLYAVAVKFDTELCEIGFGQYENMYGYSCGWSAVIPSYGAVIAWREIEPFEEVEE